MNHPVYPEFKPQAFHIGDHVQVRRDGQYIPATVEGVYGDKCVVRNKFNSTWVIPKNDIFPAALIRDTEEQSPGGQVQQESSQQENPWKNFTPESLSEHLSGGGKAFYSPADDPALNAPVHDTWMGEKSNLEKFVDFESVRSGKAKISYDPPQAQKPQMERFKGLSESEIRTYLQTGGNFRYFDESVKSAKPEGGLSLNEMMKDREGLATDENVSAWFKYQMLQQQQQQTATAKKAVTEQTSGESKNGVDAVQTGLDAAGVVDPTPVADGTNMVISLARAAKEPERMGEHLINAGVSAVSMIPYIGDLAKGLKYGGNGAKAGKATEATAKGGADGVSADPGVIDDFMQELFRTGEVGGNLEEFTNPQGSKKSLFGSIKRRLFGSSNKSDDKNGDKATANSGGGSGDDPPNKNLAGGQGSPNDPNDEVIKKNLGGLKDPAMDLAGAFGKVTAGAYAFAEVQYFLNKAIIEYNRNLLKFNGELTAAYSKLDMSRLRREFDQAQKQGESLSGLIDAQDGLEQAIHEFRGDFQIIATDVQAALTKAATLIVRLIDLASPFEELWPLIKIAIEAILKMNPTTAGLIAGIENEEKAREAWGALLNANNPHVQRIEQIIKRAADAQKRGRKV